MTNSKLKLKFPLITPFFIIALITCTIIRYLQYTTVIEPHIGFFMHGGGFLNDAYYIFFVIAAVGFLVLSLIDKRAGLGILRKKSAGLPLSPIYSIIGAGLFAYCGFLLAFDAYTAFNHKVHIIQQLALAFAAAGFTFAGFVIFTYRKLRPFTAMGFLFIAANFVCNASLIFMERIYTPNLTVPLTELSVYLLLAVFFLNSGRVVIQSETRFTAATASVCGYALVLLTISDSLSRLVYYYYTADTAMQKTLLSENNGFTLPTPLFIVQSIAALWLILALTVRNTNQIEQTETEVEEIEEVETIPVEANEPETPDDTEEVDESDADTDVTD